MDSIVQCQKHAQTLMIAAINDGANWSANSASIAAEFKLGDWGRVFFSPWNATAPLYLPVSASHYLRAVAGRYWRAFGI
jgi:hypothetical protein